MTIKTKEKNRISSLVAFILAIAPVLDPYSLVNSSFMSIKLMDIPMVLIVAHIIFTKKKYRRKENGLSILLCIFTFLTLTSFLTNDTSRNVALAIKVIVFWSMYAFCLRYLWQANDIEKFVDYAIKIAIISTLILMIQFIAIQLGFSDFFDGRIPFLQLGKTEGWAPLIDSNTGAIRVHSVFQEPSYFAIYCLPALAELLKRQKLKQFVFILIGMILTSSLIAIVGSLSIIVFSLLTYKKFIRKSDYKFWIRILLTVFISTSILIILYNSNESVRDVVDYAITRISKIGEDLQGDRMGSTKIRLLGYVEYFKTYPILLKFIGVGASQYPLYLIDYGVLPYSSTAVTILLNYGIIGFIAFMIWIISMSFKVDRGKLCFIIIFIIICIVDSFWFNWYFYYILTWILCGNNK